VPAESRRPRRRIGSRDRWFLVLAATALLGTPITALLVHDDVSSTPGACVRTVRASIMGGATFTYCGLKAVEFCRSATGEGRVAAGCETLGLATGFPTSLGSGRPHSPPEGNGGADG
jgi:hypothetical protein